MEPTTEHTTPTAHRPAPSPYDVPTDMRAALDAHARLQTAQNQLAEIRTARIPLDEQLVELERRHALKDRNIRSEGGSVVQCNERSHPRVAAIAKELATIAAHVAALEETIATATVDVAETEAALARSRAALEASNRRLYPVAWSALETATTAHAALADAVTVAESVLDAARTDVATCERAFFESGDAPDAWRALAAAHDLVAMRTVAASNARFRAQSAATTLATAQRRYASVIGPAPQARFVAEGYSTWSTPELRRHNDAVDACRYAHQMAQSALCGEP